VVSAPDGWPLWTSGVRPGREHDTTALRAHGDVLAFLAEIGAELATLGDLGYEGEKDTVVVAFKKPKGGELTEEQKAHNKEHNGKRAVGERANALLKVTFKALRRVSLCPWKIGKIVAAALVLLHVEHDRTT
jgi:DDE superfamily endonuclease